MEFIDLFVHIVKLISRRISGSQPENNRSPAETDNTELKRKLEQIKKSHQSEGKSSKQSVNQRAKNAPTTPAKPKQKTTKNTSDKNKKPAAEPGKPDVQQEKIIIDNTPVESPSDDFGLSLSAIGKEDTADADAELETMLREVQQILARHDSGQKSTSEEKKTTRQIIEEAEQANNAPFAQKAAAIKQMFEELRQKPKTDMVYFVMYDIENNKIRTRVAKYLEEKGLRRIQRSIFMGQTKQKEYETIRRVLTEIQESYENNDSIIIVPVPEDLLKTMYLIGKEVDFELTLHRCNTVFI